MAELPLERHLGGAYLLDLHKLRIGNSIHHGLQMTVTMEVTVIFPDLVVRHS